MYYKPINGFTKAKILEVIKARPFSGPALTRDGEGCVYLDPSTGNKCAVGMFIPDGHEGQKYQGFVSGLLSHHPDLEAVMPLELHALGELQTIHDSESGTTVANGDGQTYRPQFDGNAKAAMIDWVEKNVIDDTVEPSAV